MSLEQFTNLKPVEDVVSHIRELLRTSTKCWSEISRSFLEASEMYELNGNDFKKICEQTGFSKSKVSKLISIANCPRLATYADKLCLVQSWGTLYAIASLSPEKFQDLKRDLKLDDDTAPPVSITQAQVTARAKQKRQKRTLTNYASVLIDPEAFKGDLVDGEDLQKLNDLLDQIESLSQHLAVKRAEWKDGNQERMGRIDAGMIDAAQKQFDQAIKARFKGKRKRKDETLQVFELRCLGRSRSELMADFKADRKAAFEWLGVEYEESKHLEAAGNKESERAARFAKKVLTRCPPSGPKQPDEELKMAA